MLHLSEKGLYCEAGNFYIDPTRGVETALITHAHSDHARRGSQHYYCTQSSVNLLKHRLGQDISVRALDYRESIDFGGVRVSFHPAGHILGSAQIRLEMNKEVWVVSGDYKREEDPTCESFESLKCDTFITEATFGSPHYDWSREPNVIQQIFEWWMENAAQGKNSLLFCYALGKTQRILAGLKRYAQKPILLFGEAVEVTECYRQQGIDMAPTEALVHLPGDSLSRRKGELILAPHSISKTPWITRLGHPETAFASGWMQNGGSPFHRRYDRGFVLSDHADWPGLLRTIHETHAHRILVMHAGNDQIVRHLRKQGQDAALLTQATHLRANNPVQLNLFKTAI